MTKRRVALILTALALAIGQMLWIVDRHTPEVDLANGGPESERESPLTASLANTDGLQKLATSSCQCERAGGSEGSCWSAYRSAIAGYRVAGMATACAPVSSELDCIVTDAGETCIVTGYYVNAAAEADTDVTVCTADEARAIEHASADAFTIDGKPIDLNDERALDQANKAAQENISRVLDRIRRGEVVTSEPTPGSCA